MPAWCRLSARLSPPIPPPTTMTFMPLRIRGDWRLRAAGRCSSLRRGPHILDRFEGGELDVLQVAAHLLNLADVDVVDHVTARRIDRHRTARTCPGHALHRCYQCAAAGITMGLFQRLVDEVHAVVAAHRHEVCALAGLFAVC